MKRLLCSLVKSFSLRFKRNISARETEILLGICKMYIAENYPDLRESHHFDIAYFSKIDRRSYLVCIRIFNELAMYYVDFLIVNKNKFEYDPYIKEVADSAIVKFKKEVLP